MDQLLTLLARLLLSSLTRVYLLEVTDGVEKVSNDLEVGAQPPIQEHKQQRNQTDNK
ncbi:MAG TPA: hypothetical protein VGQ95_01290 [Chthoniobacterales bacterium]|nr:hypothetical protein [Chthoniobacterales bacterium]HVS81182.1 hypothetical protein [Pyrinomonadaceae bacterium]